MKGYESSFTDEQINHFARNYGTPIYLYNLDAVNQRILELQEALPEGAKIFHSLKSNPLPALVRASLDRGCIPEVCSTGELDVAIIAGGQASQFLYSGPGKSEAEIEQAMLRGVRRFSIESWNDLLRIEKISLNFPSIEVSCLLRVNPKTPINAGLSMGGAATQFGFEEELLIQQKTKLISISKTLSIVGFHIYYGTQIPDEDTLVASFAEGIACAERLCEALEITPLVLDLGGGFPWPYAKNDAPQNLSSIREKMTPILNARKLTKNCELWFESGRYITASSGTLVGKVLDVKVSKSNQKFVVLDTGINHLGGMSGLGRVVRPFITINSSRGAKDDDEVPANKEKSIVVGPLCSPLDRLTNNAELDGVEVGDFLSVPNVGAYGLSVSLTGFLSHPAPKEIVVKNNEVHSIYQLLTGHQKI